MHVNTIYLLLVDIRLHLVYSYSRRLPDHLIVSWPSGNEVVEGQERQAGQTVGDIKVEIANRKGEKISKLPTDRTMTSSKKLLVELKVIWHCELHF